MQTFKDTRGRAWNVEINCDTIERVKAAVDANLLDLADPESDLLREVNLFPPLLGRLLFPIIADQAAAMKVDEQEFKRGLNGEVLSQATDALLGEIVLFFPKHRRDLLSAVLDQNREVQEAGAKLAMERIRDPKLKQQALEAMDREVSRQIQSALDNLGPAAPGASTSSASAGTLPGCCDLAPLVLTPGVTLSA